MTVTINGGTGVAVSSGAAYTFGDNSTQSSGSNTANFGFKNRIINGAMMIDQRNAGAAVTIDGTSATYTLDRWLGVDVSSGSFTVQQDSISPVGFTNSSKLTVASTVASYATTDSCQFMQRIEGYNLADLGWGTADAKTVTLSFWVRSSLTGTFGGAIKNSASTRSYPYSYTISSANTWEQKSITIAGDTTGTWVTTNGIGAMVIFCLGGGTDRLGTTGAWNANNNVGAIGQTNVMGTLNATFYITGVQLEKNPTASAFDVRPYGTELALCQRYCFVPASNSRYVGQCDATTRALIIYVFPQTMRSGPNATLASAATYNVTTAAGGTVAGTSVALSGGFTDTAQVAISVASGLVAGNASLVTASGTTIFSAEL